MEKEKIYYILRYYDRWMTEKERLARRHLFLTEKVTHGRTDAAAQAEVRNGRHRGSELLSDDPQVLQLASEGSDSFCERTAQRIFDEHSSEIVFNTSPRCGVVAKTPKAKQCRFCRHDWHEPTSS